jgi:hypothetical protein
MSVRNWKVGEEAWRIVAARWSFSMMEQEEKMEAMADSVSKW